MYVGRCDVIDLLFVQVDRTEVEVSCYNYIWWVFVFYIILSGIGGDGHFGSVV